MLDAVVTSQNPQPLIDEPPLEQVQVALIIKSADETTGRRFTGLASTPDEDEHGHSIDPLGVSFTNPAPLLFHHDQRVPVGEVIFGTPTAAGVPFEATIPMVVEPGLVKEATDRAAHLVKYRLIRRVSAGLKPIRVEPRKNGLLRIVKSVFHELSLVTVPANAHASILAVKSLAMPARKERSAMKQTTAEHIQNLENKRAALAARMTEIMGTAAEADRTLNEEESTEHDGLGVQVKSLDADLARWREHERLQITTATPVPVVRSQITPPRLPVISVRPNVPLGTAFVRAACATLVCKGNFNEAAEYAKRWEESTPEVALYLKAAVAAGNTTDATWAGPLVNQNISADFLELLRPATILGKIGGLRNVPFNTKVPSQTAGGTYGWVGEAKPKPVTKLAFSSETLGVSKAAGIIVLTEELVRLSNPSAEALVRQDMIAGIAQFLDDQFINPAVAAVAGVSPASITNGAPTDPLADLMTIINNFTAHNVPMSGLTIIMSEANALALSFKTYSDGSPQFPGIGIGGGSYRGINFVTSTAANGWVIGVQPSLVLYADEGGVTIDASREASVQMDSAPASPADATTVLVSLWQHNLVGLRAERFINWKRANPWAVTYLTAANYPAPAGMTEPTP
jgi:HK97 family phage major capsid protein